MPETVDYTSFEASLDVAVRAARATATDRSTVSDFLRSSAGKVLETVYFRPYAAAAAYIGSDPDRIQEAERGTKFASASLVLRSLRSQQAEEDIRLGIKVYGFVGVPYAGTSR